MDCPCMAVMFTELCNAGPSRKSPPETLRHLPHTNEYSAGRGPGAGFTKPLRLTKAGFSD